MPNYIQDEDKWERAKKIASEEGHTKDYDYIVSIYKKLGGKIKKNIEKGVFDSIGVKTWDLGAVGWYNQYRKYWERVNKEDKKVKR